MRVFLRLSHAVALLTALHAVGAQGTSAPPESGVAADRTSPEAAVGAMYAAITGPAGQARDWARFRALFAPEGRLTRVGRTPAGAPLRRSFTPAEFAAQTDSAMRAGGYEELELRRTVARFGAMAHVLSAYEARDLAGALPARRGLNSVQLYEDAAGWHIQSVLWDVERSGVTWPPDVMPAPTRSTQPPDESLQLTRARDVPHRQPR